jgi:hypothetical protein
MPLRSVFATPAILKQIQIAEVELSQEAGWFREMPLGQFQ